MAYIIGLIFFVIFIVALRYFTEFNLAAQIKITLVVVSIISMAILYNQYVKREEQKIHDITLKYQQGKTIKCNGKEVNASNYSLSVGTYTFIGLKGSANYQEMISASDCE